MDSGPRPRRENERQARARSRCALFPAVQQGALAVQIGKKKVNAATLRGCFKLGRAAGVSGPYALRGLEAIAKGDVFEQRIPGVGRIRLHVRCEEPGLKSLVFLVRGAGLVLTRNVSDMGPARPAVVDNNLVPYTAVLHVLEPQEGDTGWVRESETPAHDKISTSLIREPESRSEANRRLTEMAKWVTSVIEGRRKQRDWRKESQCHRTRTLSFRHRRHYSETTKQTAATAVGRGKDSNSRTCERWQLERAERYGPNQSRAVLVEKK